MLSNDKKFVKKHSNKKTIDKNFQKRKKKRIDHNKCANCFKLNIH